MTTGPGSSALDPKQLLAGDNELAAKLLTTCYPPPKEDRAKRPLARSHLMQLLAELDGSEGEPLATVVARKLEPVEALAPFERGVVAFVDLLFRQLLKQTRLDPRAQALVCQLRPRAGAAALQAESWLGIVDHPFRGILAQLTDQLIGWSPELGRSADKTLSQLNELIGSAPTDGKWAGCADTLAQLQLRAEREQQRLGKLENRLRESEQGQLRARRAQQLAAKTLNQKMGGKQLPARVADLLCGEWYHSMQRILIREGEHSSTWQRIKKLTETLIWTLQPYDNDPQMQQQLYQVIPQLADDIRELLAALEYESTQLEDIVALVETEHLAVLKGNTPEYAPFDLIANNDPLISSTTNISRGLLDQVTAVQPGHWFLFNGGDTPQRVKLLLKQDEAMQLLFVNQLGLKADQYSFEEFAYMLSSGMAKALPDGQVVNQLIAHLLQEHLQHYQQRLDARTKANQQAQAAEQESRRRAEAQAKAAAEAQRAAAAAAEAEQQRLARAEAARAEQQRQKAQRPATAPVDAEREEAARAAVADLKVGAWVGFQRDDGETDRLKLAVVLPTSDKYLFVDRNGMRKAEHKRDELVQLFIDKQASLLKQSAQFEDTLAQVVGSLRQGRKP